MVRLASLLAIVIPYGLLAWVFAASPTHAFDSASIRLVLEFSKKEIYMGENVMSHFMLYSKGENLLEIEVAKFPEFRGFWSKNISLRQGPIPLPPETTPNGWTKVEIGSYLITPMVAAQFPVIRPMKLVIRGPHRTPKSADVGENDLVLESILSPLQIKPLPAINDKLSDPAFQGAVGIFKIRIERQPVFFRKSEPVLLRFYLEGEGNFHEINDLNLPMAEGTELLSRKSFLYGDGNGFSMKSFEYMLSVNSQQNISLPPFTFSYFNPVKKRYEKIPVEPVTLKPQPLSTAEGETTILETHLQIPHKQWSRYYPWENTLLFLLFQLLLTFTVLGWILMRFQLHFRNKQKKGLYFQRQQQWAHATEAFNSRDIPTFLRTADFLVYEILSERLARNHLPRSTCLKFLEGQMSPQCLAGAYLIFSSFQKFAYSPDKTIPDDPNRIHQALSGIIHEEKAKMPKDTRQMLHLFLRGP